MPFFYACFDRQDDKSILPAKDMQVVRNRGHRQRCALDWQGSTGFELTIRNPNQFRYWGDLDLRFKASSHQAVHMRFGKCTICGIPRPQSSPEDEDLLRRGTLYVSQGLKGFVAPGYIAGI